MAGAASAAPVSVRLDAHNQRSSSGTLSTLKWKTCAPTGTTNPCLSTTNAWTLANATGSDGRLDLGCRHRRAGHDRHLPEHLVRQQQCQRLAGDQRQGRQHDDRHHQQHDHRLQLPVRRGHLPLLRRRQRLPEHLHRRAISSTTARPCTTWAATPSASSGRSAVTT